MITERMPTSASMISYRGMKILSEFKEFLFWCFFTSPVPIVGQLSCS